MRVVACSKATSLRHKVPTDKFKKSVPTKEFVLQERSDVDPHEKFDPEALGMEDWGDGFHVNPEPVVIKRNLDGSIRRTIPISEAVPADLKPDMWKDGELLVADPIPQPAPRRPQEKVVEMLSGLLMQYYSQMPPGRLSYNPLYDGIPANEALSHDKILQPHELGSDLVHVPAHEVHEWLRKLIGKRAEIRNAKTGKLGWKGDISDLVVRIGR